MNANTVKVAIGHILNNKLVTGDDRWASFNGGFNNREMTPIDFADAAWNGHAFTTWHKKNWRESANFVLGQHIGLDFDTGDVNSSINFLLAQHFVKDYASFLYTTPSHTDAAPRARVVFVLDEPIHQASNYVMASTALIWLFAGAADRKTKDACRFFYGGRPGHTDAAFPGHILPLAKVKQVIGMYKQTGMAAKRKALPAYKAGTTEEQDVVNALDKIDPWRIDYDDWVGILMAIHSEFPNGTGLRMAEAWAKGKDGEVAQKWKSFSTDGGVGIGSLFHKAKEFGYARLQ